MNLSIVLASHNHHKAIEIGRILNIPGLKVLTLDELGITEDPEEDGLTFKDNAYIKAKAALEYTSLAVIADDSGLCVDALQGAPGVKSKRFSEQETDEANNALLLEQLKDISDINLRTAHYTTAICFIDEARIVHYFEGYCFGKIGFKEEGTQGFGYDPLFIADAYHKTFALCSVEEKNKISHRGQAFAQLKEYLLNCYK